jgi:hypothetical protein
MSGVTPVQLDIADPASVTAATAPQLGEHVESYILNVLSALSWRCTRPSPDLRHRTRPTS